MSERELFAAMHAAPSDVEPRLVYADWLLGQGDPRGELILLDERERAGAAMSVEELDRLLELASLHGFPKLPDDPCAAIFRWIGSGYHSTRYYCDYGGHTYCLRGTVRLSIDVDDVTEFVGDLDVRNPIRWTFRETTVILAIISDAICGGQPLWQLVFPDQRGFRSHPRFHAGRAPLYGFPEGLYAIERKLEPRDYGRWYGLWAQRERSLGRGASVSTTIGCACGIAGLSCGVATCVGERPRPR